jgi:hypothetical protein
MRGFYIKLAAFDLSHWCTDQSQNVGKKDLVLCLSMEVREGLRMSASRERNGGIAEFDQCIIDSTYTVGHRSVDKAGGKCVGSILSLRLSIYPRVVSEYGGKGRASDVGFT